MDPDACLSRLRNLANRIINDQDARGCYDGGEDLAELVLALDGWICKGGFLPKEWRKECEPDEGISPSRHP